MATVHDKLKKLNIEPNSELGQSLIKLDDTYEIISVKEKQLIQLQKEIIQHKEDVEVMELLLMHKINKDTRNAEQ